MLEQICDFLHNYFILSTYTGAVTIANGALSVPGILYGQRFRIRGSALNDGIYTYTASGILDADCENGVTLADEVFDGSIDFMGVPKALLVLSAEIKNWVDTNAAVLNSPYTSESFGGYSYTKASNASAAGKGAGILTWQDMFKSKLKAYRKIA